MNKDKLSELRDVNTVSYEKFVEVISRIFPIHSYYTHYHERDDISYEYTAILSRKTKGHETDKLYYDCEPNEIVIIASNNITASSCENYSISPYIVGHQSLEEAYEIYYNSCFSIVDYIKHYNILMKGIPIQNSAPLSYDGEKFIHSFGNSNDRLYMDLYHEMTSRYGDQYNNDCYKRMVLIHALDEAYLLMGYYYGDDIEKYMDFINVKISAYSIYNLERSMYIPH